MSDEEVWAFLAGEPPHTGKLATTRADGSPHVAPVWYAVDERSVVFTTARYGARNAVPNELVVRLRPRRVTSAVGVAL